jgi:glycosyltransferase involved in cell wall biosynthesis
MASEWLRTGHDVMIVTATETHLRTRTLPTGHSIQDGVPFFALRTSPYRRNGPARMANIISFRYQLYRHLHRFASWRPDAVVASSTHPMDVRPARRLASSLSVPLAWEVHDLWPLTPRLLGDIPTSHPAIRWMQREEDFACRNANVVVSILPNTRDYLAAHGMPRSRWTHVSNGVPATTVPEQPLPARPPLKVAYFGHHGPANDLSTLLQAARLLKDEPVEVHLTGDGPLKAQLMSGAAGLPNVHFHPPISQQDVQRRMLDAHLLYQGSPRSALYEFGVSPNKLFEYMSSGRPVLTVNEPGWRPCAGSDFVYRAHPGDPASVAAAILTVHNASDEELYQRGRLGHDYVQRYATHEQLAKAFLAAVA